MEKYISLAQVEQLIDEMERSSDIYGIGKIFRDFKSKLSSLPTEESGWIAVSERLPEVEQYYLVWSEEPRSITHHGTHKAYYHTDGKYKGMFSFDFHLGNVTYWMPLPKPPLQ